MDRSISKIHTKYRDGMPLEFSTAYAASDARSFHDFTMAELEIHKTCASMIDDITAEKLLIQKKSDDAQRQDKEKALDAVIAELKEANNALQDSTGKRSGYTGFKKLRGPDAQQRFQKAMQLLDDYVRQYQA